MGHKCKGVSLARRTLIAVQSTRLQQAFCTDWKRVKLRKPLVPPVKHWLLPSNALVGIISMNQEKILSVAVWQQRKWHSCDPDISVLFLIEIQHQINLHSEERERVDRWRKKKNVVLVDFTTQRDWAVFHFHLAVPKWSLCFFFSNSEVKSSKGSFPFSCGLEKKLVDNGLQR